MAEIKKSKDEQKGQSGFETSVIPVKYVDLIEDAFHAILAIALLGIGIGVFFFSIKRLIQTTPFFPKSNFCGRLQKTRRCPEQRAGILAVLNLGYVCTTCTSLFFG